MAELLQEEDYTLCSQVLCRQQQIKTLLSLFGHKQNMTPGSLFIYGHTGTGKSLVLQKVLTYHKLPHIYMNCIECSNPRFLFEHILNNISLQEVNKCEIEATSIPMDIESDGGDDDDDDDYIQCDNMTDFVRQLVSLVSNSPLKDETLYLVLDKAERLRDSSANILPVFLRLQELSCLNICTILISEIVWEKFRYGTGFYEPYCLHFPDYSRQDLTEIMCLDAPTSDEKDLYILYINIVLSVFHMVCRDLRELRHIARLNYPYFIEPIEKNKVKPSDTKKLWRNIEPHLKKALTSVYLREVSSRQWELLQQAELTDSDPDCSKAIALSRSHVELPYYSKFLLIAAYLASYNPMKYDRRFFAKYTDKVSKRSKLIKKNERASNHLLGPKVFPIDRMMAIFYSIVEGKVVPTAHINVQISSLVSLHLLCQIGEDKIAAPKYKCLVTLDFIRAVARTVHFDVMRYLYDFL